MRLIPSAAFLAAFSLVAGLAQADTVLSITTDGDAETVAAIEALTAAYTAAHPDVTFEIESRPGGADGDNLVKTRLATGEAGDIMQYNSGSLFQALKPVEQLADLSDIQGNVIDSFKSVVTAPDGTIRGVPSARRWAAASITTRRSMPSWACPCPRPGPSSWPTTRRSRPRQGCRGQTYGDT